MVIGILLALAAIVIVGLIVNVTSNSELDVLNKRCPECGGKIHYRILHEQNKDGLHYVDYWCEDCGWSLRLPPDEEEE